jgi:predicted O-methyltransferase YrrM
MIQLRRYVFTAGRMLTTLLIGPMSGAGRKRLARLSHQFGWGQHPTRLNRISVDELTSSSKDADRNVEPNPVTLVELTHHEWNTTLLEQAILARLVRWKSPRTIFEFGTYDGRTCINLLANAPEAVAFTIDLPPDLTRADRPAGERFRASHVADRVTQLFGDSRRFDFSPWFDSIDFVFVDAGHTYECARADTDTAFRLVRRGGMIVWHDYGGIFPGVTRAVEEAWLESMSANHSNSTGPTGAALLHGRSRDSRNFFHIEETSLAVCRT